MHIHLERLRRLGKLPEPLYPTVSEWFVDQCEFALAVHWLKTGLYYYIPSMGLLQKIQATISRWETFKSNQLVALEQFRGARGDQEFINFIAAHGNADHYLEQNPEVERAGIGAYAHWFGYGLWQGRSFPGVICEITPDRRSDGAWRCFRFRGQRLRVRRSESSDEPWTMSRDGTSETAWQELSHHPGRLVGAAGPEAEISEGSSAATTSGAPLPAVQSGHSETDDHVSDAGQASGIKKPIDENVHLDGITLKMRDVSAAVRPYRGQQNFQWSALAEKSARELRIAAVMDEFTFASYGPECTLQQLTPDGWEEELKVFRPDLLFIESAWRGKDDLWRGKVGHSSSELTDIIHWCRIRKIPTVFWNKEDPVHFETFLSTASLFDFVFTTDIDCIHRYKSALGHGNVYLLPFACQPAIHNPVEVYERKDAFCFAGAYYVRYPDRIRDLDSFLSNLPEFRSVEIYDRNLGQDNPDYQFPPRYSPYIVGTLPVEKIDMAYKGYEYAVNLNSVKHSQSMFARRIFELLASNTLTVSNYSRGVSLFFGDLVVATDRGEQAARKLKRLSEDDSQMDRIRLAGVRKALLQHSYGARLSYAISKVSGRSILERSPTFAVVGRIESHRDAEGIIANFRRQRGVDATLTLITPRTLTKECLGLRAEPIHVIREDEAEEMSLLELAGSGIDWIAAMIAEDYYGPNYLLDLSLAPKYTNASVIGKAEHHVLSDGRVLRCQCGSSFRPTEGLPARRAAISSKAAKTIPAHAWVHDLKNWAFSVSAQFAIDSFNYCEGGGHRDFEQLVSASVDDVSIDTGLDLDEIVSRAESIEPADLGHDRNSPAFDAQAMAQLFIGSVAAGIETKLESHGWQLRSSLQYGEHIYLYASVSLTRAELMLSEAGEALLPCHFVTTPGLSVRLVMLFLDGKNNLIGHEILAAHCNHTVKVPAGAAKIRLGLRISSGGAAHFQKLHLGHLDMDPPVLLGKAEHLVLTNNYPSYSDIYRNGFVHSRVVGYREVGVHVDVFRFHVGAPVSYHEYEGVDVVTGGQDALRKLLASGRYKSVLVHFLDAKMWEVLRGLSNLKIIVWLHGSEIQHWHRRAFEFERWTPEQVSRYKASSDQRTEFWRQILASPPRNLSFVSVSRSFADEVTGDLSVRLPEGQHHIIHNPVDVALFAFQKKQVSQRTKILSIRPFVSRKYANDLTVAAILKLSKQRLFRKLTFRIIGDGQLFEETLAPLRGFGNVTVERRFVTQGEMCALHRDYGLFLCPTRQDSQGVSRDEAMASGLVPITNAVAAVPEFVDDTCGILAPAEDSDRLAAGIMNLYHDPLLFSRLSLAAASRVRRQSASRTIISRELSLFHSTEVGTGP